MISSSVKALIAACHSAACAPPPAGTGGSSESGSVQTGSKPGYVPISNYGVNYDPKSASVVSSAEALDARGQINWDKIETKMLPVSEIGTLRADEREVKESSINKVVSGRERLREGYTIKLVESPSGSLHILDGHHRVAMHAALGKPVPVQIYREDRSSVGFDPFRADGSDVPDQAKIAETVTHMSKATASEWLWAAHHRGLVDANSVIANARRTGGRKLGTVLSDPELSGMGTALMLNDKNWRPIPYKD
jgi:hypothetical protein